MSTVNDQKISRDDIKSKLTDIQGEATKTVESAKNQLVAAAALGTILMLIMMFLLGRRSGKRSSAVIEVRRG